jgi:8-oxo-dGTP diphosphatase
VQEAALRELKEETGSSGHVVRLIGVYSEPSRDPRGHNVSAAFLVEWDGSAVSGGDDAASAAFVSDWREKTLAFDHAQIVADALRNTSGA